MNRSLLLTRRLFLYGMLFFTASCHTNGSDDPSGKPENSADVSLHQDTVFNTSDLKVVKTSMHTYQHISYLNTQDFGRVECNGMIVAKDGQAIIFDTPAENAVSELLIDFIRDSLGAEVATVVPTHFHADCVGGIAAFMAQKIPVHASELTIEILKEKGNKYASGFIPFKDSLILNTGSENIMVFFPGQGHTFDNLVAYYPAEQVLFGGCLIKEKGAGKGNLEDANTQTWPQSVAVVKARFPDARIVIPGHGKTGGQDLLDYTSGLFQ